MSHEGIRSASRDGESREKEAERPLPRISITPEKVKVLITEGKGMEIDWADGHRSAWSFAWLREACPRATFVEERKQQGRTAGQPKPRPTTVLPMYTTPAKPASAQAIGRYAIQFNWQDGHSGGIYSWDYLRRVCQCRECTFASEEATGTPN